MYIDLWIIPTWVSIEDSYFLIMLSHYCLLISILINIAFINLITLFTLIMYVQCHTILLYVCTVILLWYGIYPYHISTFQFYVFDIFYVYVVLQLFMVWDINHNVIHSNYWFHMRALLYASSIFHICCYYTCFISNTINLWCFALVTFSYHMVSFLWLILLFY